jgi:hypothetical protein
MEDENEARRNALIAALQKRPFAPAATKACLWCAGAWFHVPGIQIW